MSESNPVPVQLPMFDPIGIALSNGLITIVDPIDSDLAQYKWCSSGKYPYPQRRIKDGLLLFMHRIILERILRRSLESGELPDHVDGNLLNCRRNNLRVATKSTNAQNAKRRNDNLSGYKGVCPASVLARKPWRAYIKYNGRQIYLGTFNTPEEAHAAYCEAAKRCFGEFARFE